MKHSFWIDKKIGIEFTSGAKIREPSSSEAIMSKITPAWPKDMRSTALAGEGNIIVCKVNEKAHGDDIRNRNN